jgi:hypothetical protein
MKALIYIRWAALVPLIVGLYEGWYTLSAWSAAVIIITTLLMMFWEFVRPGEYPL